MKEVEEVVSMNSFFFFFLRHIVSLSELWHGKHLLAGVKH